MGGDDAEIFGALIRLYRASEGHTTFIIKSKEETKPEEMSINLHNFNLWAYG